MFSNIDVDLKEGYFFYLNVYIEWLIIDNKLYFDFLRICCRRILYLL